MKLRYALLLLLATTLHAQTRPVHTYSIVARDPQTGEMGVAVQSHWFSVGSVVTWAEAGVGAIATQSLVDPSYGPLGLDLMRAGKSAPDTLSAILASDKNRAVRQVAMIDTQGLVATWTGEKDIQAAGHEVGSQISGFSPDGNAVGSVSQAADAPVFSRVEGGFGSLGRDFSVQANLMANDKVWPAMAKAFRETRGDLAERMLAALEAAQAVGGDIRGKQSAALVVVGPKRLTRPWERVFDVRVDDAVDPLKELRRLLAIHRAYNHMNAGDLAVEHKDNEAALREYAAAEELAAKTPGVPESRLAEMMYWHAAALVNMNRVDASLPIFKKAFAIEPGWRTLTPRLPKSGLLPDDAKLIERITSQ